VTTIEKNHELRQRLSLISTSVYLLLHAHNENERIDRYNIVQEQINAIIDVMDEHPCPRPDCYDVLLP
jgi:phosphoglycerate-specific signal transduction histidine kinase